MKAKLTRLKRLMKRYGVTQDAVAASCGVTRTMVNKVINGRAVSAKVLVAAELLILAAKLQRGENAA